VLIFICLEIFKNSYWITFGLEARKMQLRVSVFFAQKSVSLIFLYESVICLLAGLIYSNLQLQKC